MMDEQAYKKLYTAASELAALLAREPMAQIGNVIKCEYWHLEELENALFEIDNGCTDNDRYGHVKVINKYIGDEANNEIY